MANCKICGENIPATGRAILPALGKHNREKHPEKIKEWLNLARQAQIANPPKRKKRKKQSNGGEEVAKESTEPTRVKKNIAPEIATVTAPKPAAVIFALGQLNIEIDPQHMYEAYLLYADAKVKHGLAQTFSSWLVDASSLLWRLACAQPPGNGNGHEEPLQAKIIISQGG